MVDLWRASVMHKIQIRHQFCQPKTCCLTQPPLSVARTTECFVCPCAQEEALTQDWRMRQKQNLTEGFLRRISFLDFHKGEIWVVLPTSLFALCIAGPVLWIWKPWSKKVELEKEKASSLQRVGPSGIFRHSHQHEQPPPTAKCAG